jgi:hypothetical protein
MGRIALVVLLAALTVTSANARPPPIPSVQSDVYSRRIAVKLPRLTRARIKRFVTSSPWDSVQSPESAALRLVTPATRSHVKVRDGVRIAVLGRIAVRDGIAMIEVDSLVYVLERCGPRVCLKIRRDLRFD